MMDLVGALGMLALMMAVSAALAAPLALARRARQKASDDALASCRHALGLQDDARVERDGLAWSLHGVAGPHGLPAQVDFWRNARNDFEETLRIRIELVGGLPAGITLEAGSGGSTLGDPILDARIELSSTSARSSQREAGLRFLQARLQDTRHDLRGCLMDILVGLPRTRVHDGAVEIEFHHDGHPLPELLERLGALGAALSDPPEPDAQPDDKPQTDRDAARRSRAVPRRQKA